MAEFIKKQKNEIGYRPMRWFLEGAENPKMSCCGFIDFDASNLEEVRSKLCRSSEVSKKKYGDLLNIRRSS